MIKKPTKYSDMNMENLNRLIAYFEKIRINSKAQQNLNFCIREEHPNASEITQIGRKLVAEMQKLPKKPVMYSDTDSMF
jgi:hypothetical protein